MYWWWKRYFKDLPGSLSFTFIGYHHHALAIFKIWWRALMPFLSAIFGRQKSYRCNKWSTSISWPSSVRMSLWFKKFCLSLFTLFCLSCSFAHGQLAQWLISQAMVSAVWVQIPPQLVNDKCFYLGDQVQFRFLCLCVFEGLTFAKFKR